MTASKPLRAPFPWFGGKSAIASAIWDGLGEVENYIEPFFGSGAVLLLRPGGASGYETVNDVDGLLTNFWRAVKHDPEAVAAHADWPVNECDLHARHLWLLGQKPRIVERLMGDPDYHDPKAAGWWVWGICCWIGGGWCSGRGPWVAGDDGIRWRVDGELGPGVTRPRPTLSPVGILTDRGGMAEWLRRLSSRLEGVNVICGDWGRTCGSVSTTTGLGLTGVFLDPPYADTAGRNPNIYAHDSLRVAHDVREWAIREGTNPRMRIVLAGYEGEHEMPDDWRVVSWVARSGYCGLSSDGTSDGNRNRERERLWFSPHCLNPEASLFGAPPTNEGAP